MLHAGKPSGLFFYRFTLPIKEAILSDICGCMGSFLSCGEKKSIRQEYFRNFIKSTLKSLWVTSKDYGTLLGENGLH